MMPGTDEAQIKAHLAIARNFYDEANPGMTEFYVLDVEWLQAQNQRLREALRASEWALDYLVHNFVNLDGIPQDMGAEIQRIRVAVAKVAA